MWFDLDILTLFMEINPISFNLPKLQVVLIRAILRFFFIVIETKYPLL